MSIYLKEFEFENPPKQISYLDKEPLKLTNEFLFFHNKSKFRNLITQLQLLIKSYTNAPLHAAGIRDSYLKEEYSENFLIILFTNSKTVKSANSFLEAYSDIKIKPGCFYLETTSSYMLLLSSEMNGLTLGIEIMKEILKQVLNDYMNQKKFDDYIKIRPFRLSNCSN